MRDLNEPTAVAEVEALAKWGELLAELAASGLRQGKGRPKKMSHAGTFSSADAGIKNRSHPATGFARGRGGGRPTKGKLGEAPPLVSRAAARKAAGLSADQQKQALAYRQRKAASP